MHPDLKPLELEVEASVTYAAAVKLCKDLFKVTHEDAAQLTVEAIDVTKLMRFTDDFVIRVTATGNGKCRVDMRSASRLGKGDLGKNAARINDVFQALSQSLA